MRFSLFQPLLFLGALAVLLTAACGEKGAESQSPPAAGQPPAGQPAQTSAKPVKAPPFSADSAYAYVAKQVAFGPRVPNTPAHKACGDWLVRKLKGFGAKITEQEASVEHHTGIQLPIRNIIAAFNPRAPRRIMLSAHWDTRPLAEADSERQDEPIPGANDGASGVGVLLEVARQLQARDPGLGVDIFLWDAEDWGDPGSNRMDTWALGAQYWTKNPHAGNYQADFGIHLDMVGAKDARFLQEGYSKQFAPQAVNKVWAAAHALGHGAYFPYLEGQPVMDDHYYVNRDAGIPVVNIIHTQTGGQSLFFEHWHTHGDNMDVIARPTLRAVGETLLKVLYEEST